MQKQVGRRGSRRTLTGLWMTKVGKTHIQSGDGSTQKTTDLILCYALHLGERRKRSNFWKFPPLLNESSQTAFI